MKGDKKKMRVLEFGKDNPNVWKKEFTCTGKGWQQKKTPCGALLEVSAQDIQYRTHTDISGFTDVYYGFTCPLCGCFTEIPTSQVPSSVRTTASKYEP